MRFLKRALLTLGLTLALTAGASAQTSSSGGSSSGGSSATNDMITPPAKPAGKTFWDLVDAFVARDERDRLLEGGEHAEAEQIDLDDPEIRTVLLVPLDDDPPRLGPRRDPPLPLSEGGGKTGLWACRPCPDVQTVALSDGEHAHPPARCEKPPPAGHGRRRFTQYA